jgi:hypothetical protein
LLHDGAPTGERQLDGQTVPVFDAIELLRPSDHLTFEVEVRAPELEAVHELFCRASEGDIGLEDWETIRRLCADCSRSSPGPYESDPVLAPDRPDSSIRLVAASPDEELPRSLLETWAASDRGRSILRVAAIEP